MRARIALSLCLGLSVAGSLGGCSVDVPIGAEKRASADAGTGAMTTDGGTIRGAAESGRACRVTSCQNHVYACGDCVDNDGDGKIDMEDPDCLGPCQNAEDTFFGAISGQNHAPCNEDCYFDQDTGSGNDDCVWSHACDPREPGGAECSYDPNAKLPKAMTCEAAAASQSSQCASVCGPLTPNGCDCFGCCAFPGAATPVWLGSTDDAGDPTCDLAHVSDPSRCKPCTQVAGCLNPCETCELCVGKSELPPGCANGSACPAPECNGGTPCGSACLPPCPAGEACITGCCAALIH